MLVCHPDDDTKLQSLFRGAEYPQKVSRHFKRNQRRKPPNYTMNKEEYKKSLQNHYPDEPDNVLELIWYFHSVEKARKYIKLLETCNRNADLSTKVVRTMYVACDIDSVQAVSEKFITALLPFTCMEKSANPHSVAYHIRKMLDDDAVKAERRATEERIRQVNSARLPVATSSRTVNVTIQMTFPINDEESLRKIMQFVSQFNVPLVKVEEDSVSEFGDTSTAIEPIIEFFTLKSCHSLHRKQNLYRLECSVKELPATITKLRFIFPKNEPTVTCVSPYNKGVKCMSVNRTFNLQELASLSITEMINVGRK